MVSDDAMSLTTTWLVHHYQQHRQRPSRRAVSGVDGRHLEAALDRPPWAVHVFAGDETQLRQNDAAGMDDSAVGQNCDAIAAANANADTCGRSSRRRRRRQDKNKD